MSREGTSYKRRVFEDFMLRLAMQFCEKAKNSKNESDETENCIGVVIFSWTYLEAYINNFIEGESNRFIKDINKSEIKRNPTVKKYTSQVQLELFSMYTWELQVNVNKAPKSYTSGSFRTGPLCAAEDLVPPTLVSPADGSVDTGKGWGNREEVRAIIKYPVGDCRPKYIEIDYSWNADFSGEDIFNVAQPSVGKKEGVWLIFEDDSSATVDCNLYYWRARAVVDTGTIQFLCTGGHTICG